MSNPPFELHLGIRIPLRDGTHLNATVYMPRNDSGPAPSVVTLTPYNSDPFHVQGAYFSQQGLPFVIVDVRGRGNSDGTFGPYIQEAADGYDVVEWVSAQAFCNGKVGMWGASYLGYAQWVTAAACPPHLSTIIPVAAPYLGVDFPMRSNIFYPFAMQWLTFVSGRTCQTQLLSDDAFWSDKCREWYVSGRPFRELDSVICGPSRLFQEWVSHPEPDSYWDSYNPTADQYARLHIPILTITGVYDDGQLGALAHYNEHLRHAEPSARSRHYLIIGPWDHLRTATPGATFGGLTVSAASVVDMGRLQAEWYAWVMRERPKPEFLRKPVAYYLMGAEEWRYADTLEQVTHSCRNWFLDSASNATDIFHSGILRETPGSGTPDSYTYDPRGCSGPEVLAETESDAGSVVDQRVVHALHGRLFVYHSDKLTEDTDICGFFKLSAWISIDCPDTDFFASVYEIRVDGGSIRLSSAALRARYRQGLRTPSLIQTSQPLLYTFDQFTFISRRIARGNRLRLVIAPVGRLVDSKFTEKNYNGGGVVADETYRDGKSVTVRMFHDDSHRSVLCVPIGQPAEGR